MTNTSVSQMIATCIVLPVNTLEGNWVEKKKQHSPSNTNLSIPFGERASKLEPFKCPKVPKYQKIHFEAERVNRLCPSSPA